MTAHTGHTHRQIHNPIWSHHLSSNTLYLLRHTQLERTHKLSLQIHTLGQPPKFSHSQ